MFYALLNLKLSTQMCMYVTNCSAYQLLFYILHYVHNKTFCRVLIINHVAFIYLLIYNIYIYIIIYNL